MPASTDAEVRRGSVVMILSVCGFTVNTLLLRLLGTEAHEVSAVLPLLFRAGVGAAIVLTFLRGNRPTRVRPVFTEKKLILRGFVGLLGTAAYYITIPALGAGKATLLCNTYVVFAAILATLTLGERLTRVRFAWLALAFAGIVLLTGPEGGTGGGFAVGWHEVVAIAGALTAAWAVILIRQLSVEHSIGTIYLAQCVWIFLPVLAITARELPGLGGAEWALLVGAAAAASIGQLAMNEGYRTLPVAAGASLQMLWPVMTSLGGFVWFGERFTAPQLAGAVLILLGTWRVAIGKR